MADYKTGHVKRDPATGSVAVRTEWSEVGPHALHAWMVATTGSGAVTKITADIDHWDEMYDRAQVVAAINAALAAHEAGTDPMDAAMTVLDNLYTPES